MPTIDELINKYFVVPSDANPPTEPSPAAFAGCRITPLIDGSKYFSEFLAALGTVGMGTLEENAEDFILITGWWMDLLGVSANPAAPVFLDGPGGSAKLIDLLKQKARDGVDVRVLSFVNAGIMETYAKFKFRRMESFRVHYGSNIDTIVDLRSEPNLAKKCCLNIIGHSLGGAHAKLAVVGKADKAVGFTGGIDFKYNRYDDPVHSTWPFGWHDVVAKVEGPAVQRMFNFFRDMWNELIARQVFPHDRIVKLGSGGPSTVYTVVPITYPMDARTLSTQSKGSHHVQVLHTFPAANYRKFSILPTGKAMSFAPAGLFTFRMALKKAILAAEKYIYLEDWGFWSQEIMEWIKVPLQAHSGADGLKVIFVRGQDDPTDVAIEDFMSDALFNGLLSGLTTEETSRVRVFLRDDVHVHSKTVIVDDHWASIGSACCTRRSLYTDIENSVAVLGGHDGDLENPVKAYRVELWAGHFDPVGSVVTDMNVALDTWDRPSGGPGVNRSSHINPASLPTEAVLTDDQKKQYDKVQDVDSRNPSGISLMDAWELMT